MEGNSVSYFIFPICMRTSETLQQNFLAVNKTTVTIVILDLNPILAYLPSMCLVEGE